MLGEGLPACEPECSLLSQPAQPHLLGLLTGGCEEHLTCCAPSLWKQECFPWNVVASASVPCVVTTPTPNPPQVEI